MKRWQRQSESSTCVPGTCPKGPELLWPRPECQLSAARAASVRFRAVLGGSGCFSAVHGSSGWLWLPQCGSGLFRAARAASLGSVQCGLPQGGSGQFRATRAASARGGESYRRWAGPAAGSRRPGGRARPLWSASATSSGTVNVFPVDLSHWRTVSELLNLQTGRRKAVATALLLSANLKPLPRSLAILAPTPWVAFWTWSHHCGPGARFLIPNLNGNASKQDESLGSGCVKHFH